MGLYRFKPPMSGRMGTLWTLSSIREAALVEYGCMGHMLYGRVFLNRASVSQGCKLYSTHIDEADISLGDTTRLDKTIAEVIKNDHPKVIFLLPSAVPTVIGTDLPALCKELQPSYPDVRLLPFGGGGFDVLWHQGVSQALALLVRELTREVEKASQPTFNIIGSCADMFRFSADAQEIVRLMEGAFGMKAQCILTSDTSIGEIQQMGAAHINLVIRREGEAAAKLLQERFGTPYLLGRPYGIEGTGKWLRDVQAMCAQPLEEAFIAREVADIKSRLIPAMPMFTHMIRSHPEDITVSLGGHADVVRGILGYVKELSLNKGTCWCDCQDMASEEIPYLSEDEWSRAIASQPKGLLMASGEAIKWAGRNLSLQIANPDIRWRLSPYEAPFVGYRGAVNLTDLWLNAAIEAEEDE